MKLYNSIGPNPKVVRMFLAEKELNVDLIDVDLIKGDNRRDPYLKINSMGQIPALDAGADGIICEVTAICEYLEDCYPEPALIGRTPAERAETRMWTRRIDLNILEPMTNGFRYSDGLALFESRIHCIPEAAAGLKTSARRNLAWLEQQLGDKVFICGDRFSLADVMAYSFLSFFSKRGQAFDPAWVRLNGWLERVGARPSAKA